MELLRSESFSIELYIKNCILATRWAEENLKEDLVVVSPGLYNMTYDDDWIDMFEREEYESQGEGRGLVYFDIPSVVSTDFNCAFNKEQSSMIKVYNTSDIVVSGYQVNYKRGQILYTGLEEITSVDYYWNFVSVIDAWPHQEIPQLPIVSILKETFDKKGIQLGGGHKRQLRWHIEIFGSNKGERDDLVEIILEGLDQRHCPFYKLAAGLPLTKQGTFNSNFNTSLVESFSLIEFLNVKSALTSLPNWGFYQTESINKYRAEITFSTESYYS